MLINLSDVESIENDLVMLVHHLPAKANLVKVALDLARSPCVVVRKKCHDFTDRLGNLFDADHVNERGYEASVLNPAMFEEAASLYFIVLTECRHPIIDYYFKGSISLEHRYSLLLAAHANWNRTSENGNFYLNSGMSGT